jgi:hypothetical protein
MRLACALLCRILGHKIDRRHVWHDEIDFRTTCRRCGGALLRDLHGWRPFDSVGDADERRLPHPRLR